MDSGNHPTPGSIKKKGKGEIKKEMMEWRVKKVEYNKKLKNI